MTLRALLLATLLLPATAIAVEPQAAPAETETGEAVDVVTDAESARLAETKAPMGTPSAIHMLQVAFVDSHELLRPATSPLLKARRISAVPL